MSEILERLLPLFGTVALLLELVLDRVEFVLDVCEFSFEVFPLFEKSVALCF
jgi:hypothetical protein